MTDTIAAFKKIVIHQGTGIGGCELL